MVVYSDTAIANGEASSAHNSMVKSDHDTGHTTTTDYFDMVPSTGVSYCSI